MHGFSGAEKSRSESKRQCARHPVTRGYRCHREAEIGVPRATAGKRLLVSKDTVGKLMTIEFRQAEVRRPLMAVKPMTQQGQWVCFGPDPAFACKINVGRAKSLENTLEAPSDVNRKLEEVMDIMMTEQRLEKTEKVEHLRRLPHAIEQVLSGPQKTHSFGWQSTDLLYKTSDLWNR